MKNSYNSVSKNKQSTWKMGRGPRRLFSKEDIQRANRHMKILNITNLQEHGNKKSQEDITSHLSECLSSKRQEITSIGKDVEKREPSCTTHGNVIGTATIRKQYGNSSKNWKIELSYNPAIPLQLFIEITKEKHWLNKISSPPYSLQHYFFNLFILFIYSWLRWVFIAVRGLSLVVAGRGYSSLQCTFFSLLWLLLLQSTGSRHVGFSSCGTWAQ